MCDEFVDNPDYDDSHYHYFGRFIQAAYLCKSIFDSAGIASAAVER